MLPPPPPPPPLDISDSSFFSVGICHKCFDILVAWLDAVSYLCFRHHKEKALLSFPSYFMNPALRFHGKS